MMSENEEKRLLESASDAFKKAMKVSLRHKKVQFIVKSEGDSLYKVYKNGKKEFIKKLPPDISLDKTLYQING
jgi:hypothetical protein